jgi:DNA-binding winged helix-turn-helix (wHTH) protein
MEDRYSFGLFRLDLDSMRLLREGVNTKLRKQPANMLKVLIEHEGITVSYENLVRWAWAKQPQNSEIKHTACSAANAIKKAIGKKYDQYIVNIPSRGYRFSRHQQSESHRPVRVALMPFEDNTRDHDMARASDDIREEIRARISKDESFVIIDAMKCPSLEYAKGDYEINGTLSGYKERIGPLRPDTHITKSKRTLQIHIHIVSVSLREDVVNEAYEATEDELESPAWRKILFSGIGDAIRVKIDQRNKIEGAMVSARVSALSLQKSKCEKQVQAESFYVSSTTQGLKISGNSPPRPPLVIGREEDFRELKERLFRQPEQKPMYGQVITVMRGLPGVGKSTTAAFLANDSDAAIAFPEGGPLYASLGQKPDLFSHLDSWGRALGATDLGQERTLEKVSQRIAALLRHRRMLLIIDDVWQVAHARALMVGGNNCAVFITTRETKLAEALAPRAEDVYHLQVLNNEDALKLLAELAPQVINSYPAQSRHLVQELEGLPLALQVAGRLLHSKSAHGYQIENLLTDIGSGAALLQADVPADMADLINQSTPKVAALLKKSTDLLDDVSRERFALLGLVPEKPATFDLDYLKTLWNVRNPLNTAELLSDLGLMEPVIAAGKQRYQMHSLLVAMAYSMLIK